MTVFGTAATELTLAFGELACDSTLQRKIVPCCRRSMAVMCASSVNKEQLATRTALHQVTAKTHFPSPEKIEMFSSLEQWAETSLLSFLNPVEKCWQPEDYLPDPCCEGFYEQVRELRERSADLPQDYLVCLVGDMITEEALPTYQTMLNTLEIVRDLTGASPSPWARWSRAWTAEENRHGAVLSKYLYLTGRINMRQVDKTIQYLIGSGMDPKMDCDPYLGFVYTSFQERATFISHGNTARMAKQHGDVKLAQICGAIAADEKRHEKAYTKIVEKLFEVDPSGAMEAFGKMMRRRVTMPAHLMRTDEDEKLFERFSAVAERLGVYTGRDYADIVEHLVQRWNVEKMEGLSSRAGQEQDYVCGLARRIRKVEDRADAMKASRRSSETMNFNWIAQQIRPSKPCITHQSRSLIPSL